MKRTVRAAMLGALSTLALALSAAPAAAQAITEAQVRAIIDAHPDIVLNAINKGQQLQRDREANALGASTAPVAEQVIKGDKQVASIGASSGVPIVEFFDYNCGFCKRFHAETATPLLAEGKTKLILVHTPILGPGSHRMAEFAAAANLQGKFAGAHEFLIAHNAKTAAEADALVGELVTAAKIDRTKFDRALSDGSARAQVDYNAKLAERAGAQGTPLVYAGGKAIPGAIPLGPLKDLLATR